jgi:hypothetical protein
MLGAVIGAAALFLPWTIGGIALLRRAARVEDPLAAWVFVVVGLTLALSGVGIPVAMLLRRAPRRLLVPVLWAARPLALLMGMAIAATLPVLVFVGVWSRPDRGVIAEWPGVQLWSAGTAVAEMLVFGVGGSLLLLALGGYLIRWAIVGWKDAADTSEEAEARRIA